MYVACLMFLLDNTVLEYNAHKENHGLHFQFRENSIHFTFSSMHNTHKVNPFENAFCLRVLC